MNSHSTRRRRFDTEVPGFLAYAVFAAAMLLVAESRVDAESPAPSPTLPATKGALRAAGIEGAILIDSADSPRDATLDAFANDNRTPSATWVVVTATSPGATSPNASANANSSANAAASSESVLVRLARRFEAAPGESFTVVRASDGNDSARKRTLAALSAASHVWLDFSSPDALSSWLADESLRSALADVRRRGGLIAGARSLAKIASHRSLAADRPALNWIPDLALSLAEAMPEADQQELGRWRDWLEANPGHVGLRLAIDSAFLLRGRQLDLIADGKAVVRFAAARLHDAVDLPPIDRGRSADLTDLRRTARQRLEADAYPPADLAPPYVPRGTLLIVGGGGMPKEAFEEFVRAAGGAQAKIVVLPISMPDPLPKQDGMAAALRRAGVESVVELTARTPEEIDRPESLAALREATGVWFGGGRQWRFVDAYEGTEAERLIHAVLRRGGIIGGSSAGASIQGDFLVRGHPLGPQFMIAPGYLRGMSFLPGTAIDQHFTQRKRQADLEGLLARFPQYLGIGLDETTAIIVRGEVAKVVGKHHAHFFDPSRRGDDGRPRQDAVPHGGAYDLARRRVLEEQSSAEAAGK